MTNAQLYLTISMPTLLVLLSILGSTLVNRAEFRSINRRLDEMALDIREIRSKVGDHGERIAKLEVSRR